MTGHWRHGRTWRRLILPLASLLLFICVPVAASAQSPAPEQGSQPPAYIDEMVKSAQDQGMRVIILEPGASDSAGTSATRHGPRAAGSEPLVALAGTVTKRIAALIERVGEPDWPAPSSNPMKPLQNGLLALLGLILGGLLVWRLGFYFRPVFPPTQPPVTAGGRSRPQRVILALVGIAIQAALALILPLAIWGGGSKTVELVGIVIDVFVTCSLIILISGAMLESVGERLAESLSPVKPQWIERHIRVAFTLLFFLVSGAYVVAFMYPDEDVRKLLGLVVVTIIVIAAAVLIVMHRADLRIWARNAFGERVESSAHYAWVVGLCYLAIAWVIACARMMLDLPRPIEFVLSPFIAILIAFAAYHSFVYLARAVFDRPPEGTLDEAEAEARRATASDRMHWAEGMARMVAIVLGAVALLDRWGVGFLDDDGTLGFVPTAALVVLFGYGIWTFARDAINRRIALESGGGPEEMGEGEGGAGQSRLATLLPLMKNTVFITVVFLGALMLLYEAGVNITPIFASAGIIGLAIGFGAQSLVRDVISGLFFLVDDAFRLGEYIEVGGVKGRVERISVRSMQLRHHNGPLNTIPFGEIKEVINYSRDWVIMKLPIKLTLDTDPEKVRKMVKALGQELLEHPLVGDRFLEPLKSQGVLSIDNWGTTMRVKFKTRPGDQFVVRRVVYAALHDLFEREGIQFASRDVRVHVEDGDQGEKSTAAAVAARAAAALTAEDAAAPPQGGTKP